MDIDLKQLSSPTNNIPYPGVFPIIYGYQFKDDGIKGANFDLAALQYIGSKELRARTLTSKDNTLFLGNISLKTPSIKEIQKRLLTNPISLKTNLRNVPLQRQPGEKSPYNYTPYTLNYRDLRH